MTPFDYPEVGASVPASGSGKESAMLKSYSVVVDGHPTTLRLSDEDAKAMGLLEEQPKPAKKASAKQAPKAANKARTARNKSKG